MGALDDGMSCVSELLNKKKVLTAVSAGWDLSEPGCLPVRPGAMHTKRKQRQSRVSSSSSRVCKFQASSSRPSKEVVPKMMVLQTRRVRIHGYREGVHTLCRQWKCGTPENPMLDAVFTDKLDVSSSHMATCRSCEWQQKCLFPTTSSTPPQKIEETSSSSSSSSTSSSS